MTATWDSESRQVPSITRLALSMIQLLIPPWAALSIVATIRNQASSVTQFWTYCEAFSLAKDAASPLSGWPRHLRPSVYRTREFELAPRNLLCRFAISCKTRDFPTLTPPRTRECCPFAPVHALLMRSSQASRSARMPLSKNVPKFLHNRSIYSSVDLSSTSFS